MNTHPYLRAYMAGIAIPTVFILVVFAGFCTVRFGYRVDVPLERVIVFPLALVPNLWGVWNIVYEALHDRRRLPIGLHGALLPVLIFPIAIWAARNFVIGPLPDFAAPFFSVAIPVVVIIYYLVWKYFVSFLNRMLGIA